MQNQLSSILLPLCLASFFPSFFSSLPFPASQLASGRTIKSFPSLSHPLSRMMTICLLKQHCDIMLPPHPFHHLSLLSSFPLSFSCIVILFVALTLCHFLKLFCGVFFFLNLCFLALFFFLFVCKPVSTSLF